MQPRIISGGIMNKLFISPFLFVFISTSAQNDIIGEFEDRSYIKPDSLMKSQTILKASPVSRLINPFHKSKNLGLTFNMPEYTPPKDLEYNMPEYVCDPSLSFNMPIARIPKSPLHKKSKKPFGLHNIK